MSLATFAEFLTVNEETGEISSVDDIEIEQVPVKLYFNLAESLGVNDGKLSWGYKNYHIVCKDLKIVAEDDSVYIEGFYEGEGDSEVEPGTLRFDLNEMLCIYQRQIFIRLPSLASGMTLTEVPWMKFKVVAEPDLAAFARDPVMKAMLSRISQQTAEYMRREMKAKIDRAIEASITQVMNEAIKHAAETMESVVQAVAANREGMVMSSQTLYNALHWIPGSPNAVPILG
jgi:hypothetical protein